MRVEQEVGRHHDGGEHVVEVVRDAAGKLADGVHLLHLRDLLFEIAYFGRLDRVDDRGLALGLVVLDGRDIEARRTISFARQRNVNRRDVALPVRRLHDRGFERLAVVLGDDGEDRAPFGRQRLALHDAMLQPHERRVRARDLARFVDGRDRHRRVVEEANEAHFGRAQRIGHLFARAVEHQRARRARRSVGRERDLVIEPHRHGAAATRLEIEIVHNGLHVARIAGHGREQRRAVARHDVGDLQAPGADLREVVVEPARERCVEIADVALRIDREEAGRRVIEIVDRVLQFLKDVLLPVAVARDVAHRPRGPARILAGRLQRPHAEAQPARGGAIGAGHARLFLQRPALARRLREAIDRLRHRRIADERPFDRPHVIGIDRIDQRQVRRVGVDHAALRVGDENAVGRTRRNRVDEGVPRVAAGEPDDARGAREQAEHADHRKRGQKCKDIGLRVGAADEQEGDHRPDQQQRHRENEPDAAATLAAAIDRGSSLLACVLYCRHAAAAFLSCHANHLPSVSRRARRARVENVPFARFLKAVRRLVAASRNRSLRPPPCSARAAPPRRSRPSHAAHAPVADFRSPECRARPRSP